MRAALRVETIKLLRSIVGTIGTLALVGGTLALLAGITAALASGNPELTAKIGAAATLNWSGLLASAAQITAAGGLLGFGIVLAWMFGREFSEGTITGLFALPVSRAQIAFAKLVVYAVWAIAVSLILTFGILILGLLLSYGTPSTEIWAGLARQSLLTILTAALAVPVAWIATLTRSMLAAVGSAIAIVIIAQVSVLAGVGAWMPLAAPALWAMSNGDAVGLAPLALTGAFGAVFTVLTCAVWARLQLDR